MALCFQLIILQDNQVVAVIDESPDTIPLHPEPACIEHCRSLKNSLRSVAYKAHIEIDNTRPFQVHLFRSKNATEVTRSFWHTELLDGVQRVGNTFEQDEEAIKMESHTALDAAGLAIKELERKYTACGILHQLAHRHKGRYILRLSRFFHNSSDDHVFQLTYHSKHKMRKSDCDNISVTSQDMCNNNSTTCSDTESITSDESPDAPTFTNQHVDARKFALRIKRGGFPTHDDVRLYQSPYKRREIPRTCDQGKSQAHMLILDELLQMRMRERNGNSKTGRRKIMGKS